MFYIVGNSTNQSVLADFVQSANAIHPLLGCTGTQNNCQLMSVSLQLCIHIGDVHSLYAHEFSFILATEVHTSATLSSKHLANLCTSATTNARPLGY